MSLFQLVRGLKESSTYQAILREGREEGLEKGRAEGLEKGRAEGLAEAAKILIRLGTKRFGPPEPSVAARIEAFTDAEHIRTLSDRLLEAAGWDELLAGE
jgi:flagellar biosynthesis/type III secretory pathway protein FliH